MSYVLIGLFIAQILTIFFTTRFVTNALFVVFFRKTRSEFGASWLLALVYLPGTIIHELSHFLTAIALLLPVGEISLLPEIKKIGDADSGRYYVKLGHVTFGHRDYVRTMLVGIAPLIAGLGFFYVMFDFDLFPTGSILLNILGAYVLFSVSSSMFSSKKDMEGTLILLPIVVLIISLMIGFRVNVADVLDSAWIQSLMMRMNVYLMYGSVSNGILFLLCKRLLSGSAGTFGSKF